MPRKTTVVPSRLTALKISLAYAALGVAWVIGLIWFHRRYLSTDFDLGLAVASFIGLTAIALGVVLDQHFRRLKEANEALSKSELRGKQALAGASQAVWEWDISTDAVYFSPEWKALLGFAETELEDRLSEWETRIHPEDLPRVRAQLDTHLRGGQGE